MPLPDPFPLPAHYRRDIECSLKSEKMNRETRKAFFSAVAASMLTYKRYPSPSDYQCVATAITSKYSFLATPGGGIGSKHVSNLHGHFIGTLITSLCTKCNSVGSHY